MSIDIERIKSAMLGYKTESALRDVLEEVADLNCPKADGFEGPDTFPACGECIVCVAREYVGWVES